MARHPVHCLLRPANIRYVLSSFDMQTAATFLNLVLVGFVSLFPPVNPLGTAFIVDPFLSGLDRDQRKAAAFKIAFYCFVICGATIVAGSWIFQLFGISAPPGPAR